MDTVPPRAPDSGRERLNCVALLTDEVAATRGPHRSARVASEGVRGPISMDCTVVAWRSQSWSAGSFGLSDLMRLPLPELLLSPYVE